MKLQFAQPWFLLLLALPPLVLSLPFLLRGWKQPTLRYPGAARLERLPVSARQALRLLPALLRMGGLMLLVVALARPQQGQVSETVQGEGVDIVLVLDISSSMASLDFDALNRLEAARQVSRQFIEARRYDRIGLVLFAAAAFQHSPPTPDHDFLRRALDEVQLATDLGIEDGTALGMGLATAANMLKDSNAAGKVIILLSDGSSNAGSIEPLQAAEAARALGMRVYAIGMGRAGQVPVPERYTSGTTTTSDGNATPTGGAIVYQESRLDEETLQAIADRTGGRYFRAADRQALEQIYAEIDALEPSSYTFVRTAEYREVMGWFLLPGLLLLILDFVLVRTAFRTLL